MRKLIGDVAIREADTTYRQMAEHYLGSHMLADFRRSPDLFYKKKNGLVAHADSNAFRLGRAAHVYIVEGRERFDKEFAVGGPINPKTGEPYGSSTKAFAEYARTVGKPVISQDDFDTIASMAAGVDACPSACELLSADGEAELVIRATYKKIPCQIRMDWLTEIGGRAIVDLKTCDDIRYFESDARRYGYANQMAFYRSVASVAADIDPFEIGMYLVAVEKKEPFCCGVWEVSMEALGAAQNENEDAMAEMLLCAESGVWPTRYEAVRTFN